MKKELQTTQAERDEARRLPDLRKQAGPGTRIWMDGEFEAKAADDVDKLLRVLGETLDILLYVRTEEEREDLEELSVRKIHAILTEQEGK